MVFGALLVTWLAWMRPGWRTWTLIAVVVIPLVRNGRDRLTSPRERLDERLAAGEISVDEHRTRRAELEQR